MAWLTLYKIYRCPALWDLKVALSATCAPKGSKIITQVKIPCA